MREKERERERERDDFNDDDEDDDDNDDDNDDEDRLLLPHSTGAKYTFSLGKHLNTHK